MQNSASILRDIATNTCFGDNNFIGNMKNNVVIDRSRQSTILAHDIKQNKPIFSWNISTESEHIFNDRKPRYEDIFWAKIGDQPDLPVNISVKILWEISAIKESSPVIKLIILFDYSIE